MKLVTDNAFSKAWKKPCPTCNPDSVNSILWYNKQCHNCKKVYTEEDMVDAIKKQIYDFTVDLKQCTSTYVKQNCEGAIFGLNRLLNSLNKQD